MEQIDIDDIWQKMNKLLKNKVSTTIYTAWLKKLKPVALEEEVFTLKAPSKLAKDTIKTKYLQYLTIAAYEITKKMLMVDIVVKEKKEVFTLKEDGEDIEYKTLEKTKEEKLRTIQSKSREKTKKIKENNPELFQPTLSEAFDSNQTKDKDKPRKTSYNPSINTETNLNKNYTFARFVIGGANEFAHAAAVAVANNPANIYNPFFMYGGVGVGKTHLMHAIAHQVLKQDKTKKVLYISCEKFTNDLVHYLKSGNMDAFREKYRQIDVLLVDDIQFLANKERIQEEFFHTFNSLKDENKQIVLSSDRHPQEIETLSDRLRSRFEGGLITDIKVPDLETRMAILEKKCNLENVQVPPEVITFIATNIEDNIRTLEGALTKVIAYASVTQCPITYKFATNTLKDLFKKPKEVVVKKTAITISLIIEIVATYFNISIEDIKSQKRARAIVYPRQLAMFLARDLTKKSLPKIAQGFGKKDHTTIMHAVKKIKQEMKASKETANLVEILISKIKEHSSTKSG